MGNTDDKGGENTQDVTEEMDSYYQTEDKSKSGSAILYGLFALVVTLIVAAGLFFGGRAVYRALTGTSGDSETTQQQDQDTAEDTSGSNTNATDNSSDGNQQGQTPGVSSDSSNDSTDSEDSQTGGRGAYEDMPSTGDNLPATGSPTGM